VYTPASTIWSTAICGQLYITNIDSILPQALIKKDILATSLQYRPLSANCKQLAQEIASSRPVYHQVIYNCDICLFITIHELSSQMIIRAQGSLVNISRRIEDLL
jgi:hypothetical protein